MERGFSGIICFSTHYNNTVVLYPMFATLGISGASFPNVDYNVIGMIIDWILGLFK